MNVHWNRIVTVLAALGIAGSSSKAFAVDHWTWYFDVTRNGTTDDSVVFGRTSDIFVQGDFDGDFNVDVAVVRRVDATDDLEWYVDLDTSGDSEIAVVFGHENDDPYPADYDGDGIADLAVVRESGGALYWYVDVDHDGDSEMDDAFGNSGDVPMPGDYDGDGAADWAVVRESGGQLHWYVNTDHDDDTEFSDQFGIENDVPLPADYNGDGETDYAVARKTSDQWTWYVDLDRDGDSDITKAIGSTKRLLRPGDYNGDGAADFVSLLRVDEHWKWYFDTNRDGAAETSTVYGLSSDYPLPADYTGNGWDDLVVLRRGWSEGTYRIPLEDSAGLRVTGDVVGHSPLGRIDMRCDEDPCEIVAARSGWIRAIEDSNTDDFCDDCDNNYVWLEHSDGEWTKYTHMEAGSVPDYALNEWVPVGSPLGIEGAVGSLGVHLHFEVAVPWDGTDVTTAISTSGFIIGYNRVPRICDIDGGTFVEHEQYVAAPCD